MYGRSISIEFLALFRVSRAMQAVVTQRRMVEMPRTKVKNATGSSLVRSQIIVSHSPRISLLHDRYQDHWGNSGVDNRVFSPVGQKPIPIKQTTKPSAN